MTSSSSRRVRRVPGSRLAVLLALLVGSGPLVAAACGDDGEDATGDTPSTEAAPEDPGDTGAFETQVRGAAQAMLDGGAANGATAAHVAISDPDRGDVVVALGTLSADGGEPASENDTFPIGSITKTFTATVVLQMIEDGDLSLDDTVDELLPDLSAELPDLAPVTVEELLTMTSGIEDYLNVPDSVVTEIVADPMRVWEPEELITAGVDAGVSPPGTAGYSTTNYLVLQQIAESLTGDRLEDLITSDVTEPLGLDGTRLPPPEDTALPGPHTRGYVAGGSVIELANDGATVEEGTDTTDWNTSFTQGGGGMYSTVGDLLAWAGSLTGTSLLGDELAERRLETAPLPEGIDYGLGILRVGSWYGHEGEAIGWEALAVQDPGTGVSVALALNGCGGQFPYFLELLDALYPDGGAMAAATGTTDGGAETAGEDEAAPIENEVTFVAGESAVDVSWTSCTWDGSSLDLSAGDGDSGIEATTEDGVVAVTVSGADEWTATGNAEESDGIIVVTGTGTSAGGAETAVTLVVYDCT